MAALKKQNPLFQVKKRDGRIVKFERERIATGIFKAAESVGGNDRKRADETTDEVVKQLVAKYSKRKFVKTEEIADVVKQVLIDMGHGKTSIAFGLFVDLKNQVMNIKSLIDADTLVRGYIDIEDWQVSENSNMTYSWQGLNNYISSTVQANYWLHSIYPKEISNANIDKDIHIHDLGMLAVYCCGWSLEDLLLKGFTGVSGKISSAPAKHLGAALGQCVNFFYTLQHEAAGAQAFSSFDTYLAPFIRYDKLTYKEVKQKMQEFLYNMNVPTRVGCQCVSEDTEILTPDGWKTYDDIEKGCTIKTYNLETGYIEDQVVESVFKKQYKGEMFNLKNRIQDQLISPHHRVVRKLFNTDKYVLQPIEEILELKSPFIIPLSGKNNNTKKNISNEQIQLMAWVISEGSLERSTKYRNSHRISIYQSKIKNESKYNEIVKLLKHFEFKYDEYEHSGFGEKVVRMRLNAESSRVIHEWFGTMDSIKFIPDTLLNLDETQSKLFLQAYLKGDGFEGCKITTTDLEILDGLQILTVNAGFGFTVLKRKPTIGSKEIYVLRLIQHQETYIQKVEKVNYEGVIWCPHTKNETIVARRNGKVFITGNTPFTNITMDLIPSGQLAEQGVIIGGKVQKEKYKDFQPEMAMLNKAFCEVMMEGDSQGRLFSFPIPTYNITKNFDWDNTDYKPVWEMTAKYGIPYFSNFVNSDMNPDDARSMCCRLRLDNRELRKRGGGLFGANPLTGSLGVVTINLPKIGYLSKTKKEYFKRLDKMMDLSKKSLLIKRAFIEKYTQKGLYPYSKFYLGDVKKRFGEYYKNHFNTIGILGLNESLMNFFSDKDKGITSEEGRAFGLEIMDHMREVLMNYQTETNQLFNLEASPGEGATYKFAKADKKKFPDIITAADLVEKPGTVPYYTNSSQLPVNYTDDIFEALDDQDEFQCKYTGGTVLHLYVGEKISSTTSVKNLVRKVSENYRLPYFSLTPTFSICPKHGYIAGEHRYCPKCDIEVGYRDGMEFDEIV
ncbi:MAG: Anaerobic ribonucleoside-triphosphate reductase [candidate division WS6 bacterium GW2011_GWC1_36_11]|uniref:Anaerobic ribonucleoside-triphosphate reductase n=2 Tax=Candidatus Dojkabacteria TaxID=74243 RepID=A0A0G0DS81_9BACT|nr:MAG: Anaerobic ribonucleoside-triphosphate reductase [candidate division WS6 bacterium GW2011_GWC1_36_11]KKQ03433.1 MAG: Anaerobic ribonucleoside-triphosphate reductase [candidate division WS6 bacterium GW2011_WS6_36_26]KKQ18011.1 MAG: Anaerobic ribonucleoside-triphosphate reductase [candidate division WS6 bacterium GW2011_GWF1_36_8]